MAPLIKLLLTIIYIFPTIGFAQTATFDSLTEADVEGIVREFSANLVHTSVTPPTSLERILALRLSVIGGVSESKKINELIKEKIRERSSLHSHAWLLLGITVPYGVNVELNYIPEVDVSGLNLQHTSAGVKWSITDQFFSDCPLIGL